MIISDKDMKLIDGGVTYYVVVRIIKSLFRYIKPLF